MWLLDGCYVVARWVPWYLYRCHGIYIGAMVLYWCHGIYIGAVLFIVVPWYLYLCQSIYIAVRVFFGASVSILVPQNLYF